MKKFNIISLIIFAGVFFAGGFYFGTKEGYSRGIEDNKIVTINTFKVLEAHRKNFLEKYANQEITEEVRQKMMEEIKETSDRVVKAIKSNYGDAVIVDSGLEGCLLYRGNKEIPDITQQVEHVLSGK